MTTEEFITKARAVHGSKYDYSKVEYVNSQTKVCIICPVHGEFWQRADTFLHSQGCPKCVRKRIGKNMQKWDEQTCYNAAKQCKSRKEFREKYGRAYFLSKTENWLEKFDWLEKKFEWTYDLCREEAKKYKTKRAFEKGNSGAYTASVRKKWINTFDWFIKNRLNVVEGNIDCVYAYYFEEHNAIYIGRTIRPKNRDKEHIFNTQNDTVAKFAEKHQCSVPPMIILNSGLTLAEGQSLENYWIEHYRKLGYNILNKAQTGLGKGSLGTIGAGKWNKTTCYKEALNFSSRKEFQRGNVGAYTRALRKGWLEGYTWLQRPTSARLKWTKEKCFQEAMLYQSITDFSKKSPGAYAAAIKNGWINQYDWFIKVYKPTGYWTYDKCLEEAKKYKSRSEFEYGKGSGTAYRIARKNGWIKDYTWFIEKQHPNGYWTYERCYTEAKKHKSRTEFMYAKGGNTAYVVARKNNWLNDYTWLKNSPKPKGYWTYERCKAEALKYKTRTQFKLGNGSAYAFSIRNKWIDDFFRRKNDRNKQ